MFLHWTVKSKCKTVVNIQAKLYVYKNGWLYPSHAVAYQLSDFIHHTRNLVYQPTNQHTCAQNQMMVYRLDHTVC